MCLWIRSCFLRSLEGGNSPANPLESHGRGYVRSANRQSVGICDSLFRYVIGFQSNPSLPATARPLQCTELHKVANRKGGGEYGNQGLDGCSGGCAVRHGAGRNRGSEDGFCRI